MSPLLKSQNKRKNMTHIMVTGGAGFIAYHLIQSLVEDGYEVSAFDNFNDYYDPELKKARADNLKDIGVDVAFIDLMNAPKVSEFVAHHKPDIVMHLAAYAGVRHSLKEPQKYIDNNITGTQNLINACTAAGVNKVLYASTSCTMVGNPLPWNEDEKCGHLLNPYGFSKMANENQFMCSDITNTISLRFFTVYGPWGRPDMALFDFTNNIVANKPIQLFNYGDMIRDFTYIDDIVQGIKILFDEIQKHDDLNEIYNIGYGEQVKLVDFVDHIEKNLNRTAIRELVPLHPADTQVTWSDTSKLQKLGYNPTTSMAEGVQKFIEWYKSYYKVN
jgi:UDP-glucuronate 4-epimerase|tara:strand:- start:2012 stop:3004 length:993 start_codon:yes stop_codon:yes gene_type:complete